MQQRINKTTKSPKHDSQANMLIRKKAEESSSILTHDYNPLENVTCKIGDNSCAAKHVSVIQRTGLFHPMNESPRVQTLLRLQQQYGNRFVQRVISRNAIQTKLTIGQPGDIYEKEADKVAEQVMRMPEPQVQQQPEEEEEEEPVQTKPLAEQLTPLVQRQPGQEEEVKTPTKIQTKLTLGSPGDVYENEANRVAEKVSVFYPSGGLRRIHRSLLSHVDVSGVLGLTGVQRSTISRTLSVARSLRIFANTGTQMAENSIVKPSIERRIMLSRGKGSPLPAAIRNSVALQTGYDFSNVRVKIDSEAAELSRSLNARAFTLGSDIWLGKNESINDVKLMAHELTHVVQQGAARMISPKSVVGFDGMKSESKVMTYLQILVNGNSHDYSVYAREIEQFKAENSPERIAKLQQQILEKPKGADIHQTSDSTILRACGGGGSSTSPSPATLKRTVTTQPTNLGCGGFTMAARWGLDNADSSTNGYVVQKLTFDLNRERCTGGRNDFQKTYWEAWQVRSGVIYIGTSSSHHNSDTFRVAPTPDHKGNTYEEGKAKFIDGYTAPSTWGNVPEAGSLPATTSQPAGWSDSGTLHRWIGNRNFDCCSQSDLGDFYHQA